MTPLASVMLLAFFFLLAVALVVWSLLAPRSAAPAKAPPKARPKAEPNAKGKEKAKAKAEGEPPEAPRLETGFSNDDVRGAKARSTKRSSDHDDAFERFLRAGRDDDRT